MVSITSIKVYNEEIKGTKECSQAEIVYKAILRFGRACTMREIQEETKLEINVVSRSLNVLRTKENKIEYVDDKDKNGRRVHYYFRKSQLGEQAKLTF